VNDDGTVLDSRKWAEGDTPSYYGPVPKKGSGVEYDYTFKGWTPAPAPLLADTTYKAQYSPAIRHYSVTFENSDGTILESKEWACGSTPSYDKVPTKPDDVKASYVFNGWDHVIEAVKGPAVYKAAYSETPKKYTISFANYDGTVLESKEWDYGATPVYFGALPTKPINGQLSYHFSGWFPMISNVNGPSTYTAQYSESSLDEISFSNTKNRLSVEPASSLGLSGNGIAVSSRGIHYSFAYAGFCNPLDRWQTLIGGGFFMNTSPIRGIQRVNLKKTAQSSSFKIYWSSTSNFTEINSQTYDVDSGLTIVCTFNGSSPAFIKIVAQGAQASSIDEGSFVFDEGSETLSLSVTPVPAEGGTVSGSGVYLSGEKVTIVATPAQYYSFVGWYQGDTLVSLSTSYSLVLGKEDVAYEARFSIGAGPCLLHLLAQEYGTNPAGTCVVNGEGCYLQGAVATISAEPQDGYDFLGWYDEATLLSTDNPYMFSIKNTDTTIEAKYSKKYHVSVSSKDETKGTVSGEGDFAYGSTVTVTGNPVGTRLLPFFAWYNGSSDAVSSNLVYSFVMPEADVSLTADFGSSLGSSFTLGRYPQTVVEDSATLTSLASATDDDGDGYLECGLDEFKKVNATPCTTGYKSESGNVTFVSGTVYYFKVEPIQWRVLSGKGTKTGLVISEKVLANSFFLPFQTNRTIANATIYANNYQYSTLRAMLNGYDGSSYGAGNFIGEGFIDLAFTQEEQEYVGTTLVDNSAATTESSSNAYACANTNDKIFPLSYQDLINPTYGFSSSGSTYDIGRASVLTDYGRATGAYMPIDSSHHENGSWWQRSPHANYSFGARTVDNGNFYYNGCYVNDSRAGIRPSFTVIIS
jgi:hypothetical protein